MAERVRFELTVHQRCTLDFESNSTVRKHSTPQGRTNKINDLRCASSATNTSKCSKMAENPARLRPPDSGPARAQLSHLKRPPSPRRIMSHDPPRHSNRPNRRARYRPIPHPWPARGGGVHARAWRRLSGHCARAVGLDVSPARFHSSTAVRRSRLLARPVKPIIPDPFL